MSTPQYGRTRTGAIALGIAGLLFVVYQAVAPRVDQTTLAGARSWSSPAWVTAHVAAIAGFILIGCGLVAVHAALSATRGEPAAFRAMLTGWIGIGLTLPYYGAEVYGLNAIGRRAVADGDASLVGLAEDFRMDSTAVTIFALGLAAVALAGIVVAAAVWRSGRLPRWSAVPLAAVLVTLIPQFFVPQPLRIAHGAALAVAAVVLAVALWRSAAADAGAA